MSLANVSFFNNKGVPVIYNVGQIDWTCQLGYFQLHTGSYGTNEGVSGHYARFCHTNSVLE
jgi:hypothetical protein